MSLSFGFRSCIACLAIFVAGGLLPLNSFATSSKLHHYSLAECSKSFCLSAQGDEAFVSLLSPTVAAADVRVDLKYKTGVEKTYSCASMAYLLASAILTCEQAAPGKTLVVDFATSEVTRF